MAALSGVLSGLQTQINNITAALAQRPESSALGAKLDELERERGRVQDEISAAESRLPDDKFDADQAVDEMLASLEHVSTLMGKSSLSEIKAVFRTFINRITIHQDEQEARFYFFKLPGLNKRFTQVDRPELPSGPVGGSSPEKVGGGLPGKSFAGPRGPANVPNQIGCGGWI